MKLHTAATPDFRALKVRVAAAIAGVPLEICELSAAPSKKLAPLGKLPVLETSGGILAQSNAILRYVAQLAPTAQLYGSDEFAAASVDSWVDWCQAELEVRAEVATLPLLGVALGVKPAAVPALAAAATAELVDSLQHLEAAVGTRTFLVGERLTLADVAVACALSLAFRLALCPDVRAKLPNTTRWYRTCVAQPAFAEVLGPEAAVLCAAAPDYSAAVAKKPSGGGGGKSGGAPTAATKAAPVAAVKALTSTKVPELFKRTRVRLKEILHAADKGESFVGCEIVVCGWARTVRAAAKNRLAFVDLNDGSCYEGLQVVCSKDGTVNFDALLAAGGTGASFRLTGVVVESKAKGQLIEMKANVAEVLGTVDASKYPLAKTGHSVEHLRAVAHLRPRTNLIACVARVRNACAFATHTFFQQKGFMYVHTPIVTASDCEGAGEMFAVTTILPEDKSKDLPRITPKDPRLKDRNFEGKVGDIDYKQDFFNRPSFLTVSGQLNVECYACALSDVYTFGPTFRAENSHTARHLAEFWMIEPEIAFATLEDDMNLAEEYVKFCVQYVIDNNASDLAFFESKVEEGLMERLVNVVSSPFQRMKYTEAVEMLNKPEHLTLPDGKPRFLVQPNWGIDLDSEHERYLTEVVYKKPVVLTHYPAGIKAFYMRAAPPEENGGRKTVEAMDVLVPRIGELLGGSAREHRIDVLEERLAELKLDPKDFDWYMDLRRYGTVPHAGFGLGFERLISFVTGVQNVRDVIPFPRFPGSCTF